MIDVKRLSQGDPLKFEVVVREGKDEAHHQVTMTQATYDQLTAGKHAPERCIEAAFQFLLDREPKKSILEYFDVSIIPRYFPEFEQELPRYFMRIFDLDYTARHKRPYPQPSDLTMKFSSSSPTVPTPVPTKFF